MVSSGLDEVDFAAVQIVSRQTRPVTTITTESVGFLGIMSRGPVNGRSLLKSPSRLQRLRNVAQEGRGGGINEATGGRPIGFGVKKRANGAEVCKSLYSS